MLWHVVEVKERNWGLGHLPSAHHECDISKSRDTETDTQIPRTALRLGKMCLEQRTLLVRPRDGTKDNLSSMFAVAACLGDSIFVRLCKKKKCVLICKT